MELIRVRVQYASRQQCCKTHKRPLPLSFIELNFVRNFSRHITESHDLEIYWNFMAAEGVAHSKWIVAVRVHREYGGESGL